MTLDIQRQVVDDLNYLEEHGALAGVAEVIASGASRWSSWATPWSMTSASTKTATWRTAPPPSWVSPS